MAGERPEMSYRQPARMFPMSGSVQCGTVMRRDLEEREAKLTIGYRHHSTRFDSCIRKKMQSGPLCRIIPDAFLILPNWGRPFCVDGHTMIRWGLEEDRGERGGLLGE